MLDNAKAQADAIMAEAREEAEAITAAGVSRRRRRLSEARPMQMVNAAKLENRRKTAALKEDAIAAVFDDAAEKLATCRGRRRATRRLFRALLEEALAGVERRLSRSWSTRAIEALAEDASEDLGRRVQGRRDGVDASAGSWSSRATAGSTGATRSRTGWPRCASGRRPQVSEILFS